ncbi:ATP-binding protein [uncultured Corynebacterium sp.]|uniref:ATP-binding protein n=1 Tax=uncultured Corynebacterium sp. TaxID=159447 RepID=UPI0028D8C3B8|nr:ATP-binding protein [uncultured Corynebacterium sp.]
MKSHLIYSCLSANDSYGGWITVAVVMFVGSLVLLAIAIIMNKRGLYLLALPSSALAYAQFLMIQITQLAHYGHSAIGDMLLGDFVGIPACLLMMLFPNWWWFATMLMTTSLVVTLHDNQLPFWHMSDFDAALYSTLISGPVLFMVYSGIHTSRQTDAAIFQNYQANMTFLRSQSFSELENYFTSRIHDKVLPTLNSTAAGLTPVTDVLSINIMDVTQADTMSLGNFITTLRDSVAESTKITIHAVADLTMPLPFKTAISLIDAVAEASHNSVQHTPQATRELAISWNGTVINVVFQDSGPGFHVDKVSHNHAGVKITMLKRPQIYNGVSVSLTSSPKQGTRYEISWTVTDTVAEPEEPEEQQDMLLYQVRKLGFDRLFRPWVAAYALAIFIFDVIPYDHTGHWHVLIISMVLVGAALWSLTDRSQLRLPWRNTIILIACVSALMTIGQLSHHPQPPELQRYGWFVSYAVVLAMYLALRLRPGMAWTMWVGFVVMTYVAESWLRLDLLASASSIIARIPLLIPATIVPLQLNWVVKSLPTLQRVDSNEYLEPDLQRYTSEMTKWLHSLLQLVDDPTAAKLMELRLRDAIRSPLLDVPELTAAVWRARAAGTRVTLIDDRSPTCANPEEHSKIITNATEALAKNPHTLTLRLLPAGRDRYASLRWN